MKEKRLIYQELPNNFLDGNAEDTKNKSEANEDKEGEKKDVVDNALDKLDTKHAKLIEAAKQKLDITALFNRSALKPSWTINVFKKGGPLIDSVSTSDPNYQGEIIRILQSNIDNAATVLSPEELQKAQALQGKEKPESRVLSAVAQLDTLNDGQTAYVKKQLQQALNIRTDIMINVAKHDNEARWPCEACIISARDKQPLAVCTLAAQGDDTVVQHIQLEPSVRELPKKTFISLMANLSGNVDLNNAKLIDEGKVTVGIVREKRPNGNYHVELRYEDINEIERVAAEIVLSHKGALISTDSKPRIK